LELRHDAIAARVGGALDDARGMTDQHAGVAHDLVEGAGQLDVVAGVGQGLDNLRRKAVLDAQTGRGFTPRPPEEPARCADRGLQLPAVDHVAGI
jgi:hypothetical protein